MNANAVDKNYWDNLYNNKDIGWDIGHPSTALKDYIDQLSDKNIAILIPGCGNAYEAQYLLERRFTNLTLIDIAPTLTHALENNLAKYNPDSFKIITGDFFEHSGKYDLVLEQTFLSALPPALRNDYAKQMHQLLKPKGKLVGVLFNKHFEENPPHGGDETEYQKLFINYFDIEIMEPCYNSIERRSDSELFIKLIARK